MPALLCPCSAQPTSAELPKISIWRATWGRESGTPVSNFIEASASVVPGKVGHSVIFRFHRAATDTGLQARRGLTYAQVPLPQGSSGCSCFPPSWHCSLCFRPATEQLLGLSRLAMNGPLSSALEQGTSKAAWGRGGRGLAPGPCKAVGTGRVQAALLGQGPGPPAEQQRLS